MTSVEIYNRCRSRELITMFNRMAVSLSYNAMKRHRSDLAKFAIYKSKDCSVPLPSHFSLTEFTIVAFDNFNHADRSSLSGKSCANDTAITVFQKLPAKKLRKPNKSDCNLNEIKKVSVLPCQEIMPFCKPTKTLNLPVDFVVDANFDMTDESLVHALKDQVISLMMSRSAELNKDIPSWGGIRALTSVSDVPLMQSGFLPFIPHPVIDYGTVYTAMRNFVTVNQQLQQKILPVFCDEGVFRIVLDIYLDHPIEFRDLLPMLGSFHMTKIALGATGKYVLGCGLDDAVIETKIFGKKTIEAVLGGTHYVRSIRGMPIISAAIQFIKWQAFWELHDPSEYKYELSLIDTLMDALNEKTRRNA